MSYIFRGRLCGYLCGECTEPLANVVVRLYRHRKEQDVTALAVADAGQTLNLVNDDQIKAKASSLIAEAKADADGKFNFDLGTKQKYSGEAFEIDVYCESVPRRKPGRKAVQARQFSVTTVQPQWKQTGEGQFAGVWEYCLPWRFWCHFRSLFDAWVICGRLTTCGDGAPIAGAVVSAFDVDWLQDDPLGSGTTDLNGRFRIDYSAADFELTPFSPYINVEWVGGPDLYFTATLGSTTILQEDRSTGRTPGRQNVGHCFCVDLCSDKVIGPPDHYPHWNKVWEFSIYPDAGNVGSQFSAEGYAGGAGSSFVFGDSNYRSGVLLRGNCPLTNIAAPANALQYRFVIGEYTWSTTPDDPNTMPSIVPAALNPVTQIRSTTVGYVYYTDGHGVYGPADVVITSADLDANGWVKPILGRNVTVDMHDGTTAVVVITESNFLRTDELMVMNSSVITAVHAPKLPGGLPKADAGRALTNAEKEPIRRYQLQFEVRDATTLATVFTDRLSSIILDNSPVIVALDLEELRTNACNPLGGAPTVHVLYTVDHPHLRNFSMAISNNGGVVHPAPPMPSGSFVSPNFFFRGGNGGPHNGTNTGGFAQNIAGDPPCAYSVSLSWSTRQYLTSGHSTQILYCK
ncbi:MAG TPA: hypothetical protein VF532_04180 [Candidatus Angelobacter sp.]